MPTDTTSAALAAVFREKPPLAEARRVLRLTLGVTAVFVLGMLLQWPLAYLSAVLAALMLQAPASPGVRGGLGLVTVTLALLLVFCGVFAALAPYPGSFLIVQALLVIWIFAQSVAGKPRLLVLILLMAALLMPHLARTSLDLALLVAVWLPVNLAFGLVATWAAFTLMPASAAPPQAGAAAFATVRPFDPGRRLWRMSLVTVPFLLAFHLLEGGALLTLIYVALLAQQLAESTGDGPAAARAKLLSTLIGGLAALAAYELLVIDTRAGFMALVVLLLCLVMARWLFSEGPGGAELAGNALTTALILLGGALAPFGDAVELGMITRLAQVAAALAWVLAAFVVVDWVLPERAAPTPSWKSRRTARPARGRIPTRAAHRA